MHRFGSLLSSPILRITHETTTDAASHLPLTKGNIEDLSQPVAEPHAAIEAPDSDEIEPPSPTDTMWGFTIADEEPKQPMHFLPPEVIQEASEHKARKKAETKRMRKLRKDEQESRGLQERGPRKPKKKKARLAMQQATANQNLQHMQKQQAGLESTTQKQVSSPVQAAISEPRLCQPVVPNLLATVAAVPELQHIVFDEAETCLAAPAGTHSAALQISSPVQAVISRRLFLSPAAPNLLPKIETVSELQRLLSDHARAYQAPHAGTYPAAPQQTEAMVNVPQDSIRSVQASVEDPEPAVNMPHTSIRGGHGSTEDSGRVRETLRTLDGRTLYKVESVERVMGPRSILYPLDGDCGKLYELIEID